MAAKCTLGARVDSFHESVDGAIGDSLRAEIEQKLDKLLEPPPVKTVKPLPAPIEQSRKKTRREKVGYRDKIETVRVHVGSRDKQWSNQ